jgi:hypothetical protein
LEHGKVKDELTQYYVPKYIDEGFLEMNAM